MYSPIFVVHLLSGRNNLLTSASQGTDDAEIAVPAAFSDCAMAMIAFVTVGLLSDGFMLYVLLHWMRDGARNRNQ